MRNTLRQTVAILLLAGPNLFAVTHYVSLANLDPTPPYTNWVTAATNIQQAANAATAGDEVLVTNGAYAGGVAVSNPVRLSSVNGPQFTSISGGGPCVLLSDGASLCGFTVTNGMGSGYYSGGVYCTSTNALITNCTLTANSAWYQGGGVSGGTLYNCTLTGNAAGYGGGGAFGGVLYNCVLTGNSAVVGGGASQCTLCNCTMIGNSTSSVGGGVSQCTLYSCTLTGNSAAYGGGAWSCALYNCIVYFNAAPNGANYYQPGALNHCCTTPLPGGVGNITDAPLFVNYPGGILRLQSNSPCINAGNNLYVTTAADLDGNPRIVGGTVDIGAYECQAPALLAFYSWLQGYGLPTDASAACADSDGDGVNNWQEYLADTSPVDAHDYLHITSYAREGTYNTLWWTSKPTRLYQVQRCAALDGSSPWETIITNTMVGWNNVGFDNMGPQYFYRVGVVPP